MGEQHLKKLCHLLNLRTVSFSLGLQQSVNLQPGHRMYLSYINQSLNKQTESEYCFRKALLLNKFPNDAYTFYNKVKKQLIFLFLK